MKKTLASLGLATALLASTGASVALAQDDASDTTQTTVLSADQDRDQRRDPALHDGVTVQLGDQDQVRDCDLYDSDASHVQMRARDQRLAAPEGRPAAGVATGTGGYGEGVADGTGPIHDGPLDGTGNQFGRGR